MAIDVQAEAKGIAEVYQPSVVDPTMLAADITSLVTRAVAEAKLKQMERDVDAVLFHCCDDRPEMCGSHHYVQSIRTAFAATEPRDAGKDDARELGLDGDA